MRRAAVAAAIVGVCVYVATAEPLGDAAMRATAPERATAAEHGAKRASQAADGRPALASRLPAFVSAPAATALLPAMGRAPAAELSPSVTAPPASTGEADGIEASPAPLDAPAATESKAQPAKPAAKSIFGGLATPAALAARSIGFYSRGCLAGGVALPIDGEVWQAMRLSRNRNWGHPELIKVVERLAEDGAAKDGWAGLLVGDLSQPRGGPMLTGHNSHQVGLDADIWLTPMPDRRLSYKERETLAATSMLGKDGIHADPEVFTPYHAALIRRAASYPEVERIFVHPGIKKAMCEEAGADRTYFHKVRPYWGHHYHMHVRISCPPGSTTCKPQPPAHGDDGCGKEIDDWLTMLRRPPKPEPPPAVAAKPPPARRQITLDDLPAECTSVATAGGAPFMGQTVGSATEPLQLSNDD